MSIEHTGIKVKVVLSASNTVQITTGLRQGALSPILFNRYNVEESKENNRYRPKRCQAWRRKSWTFSIRGRHSLAGRKSRRTQKTIQKID